MQVRPREQPAEHVGDPAEVIGRPARRTTGSFQFQHGRIGPLGERGDRPGDHASSRAVGAEAGFEDDDRPAIGKRCGDDT